LEEIVARKPVFLDYVEKLVKVHTNSNDLDKAREVITTSLAANDCNLDMWSFYINWSLENDYINRDDETKTKEIFEEARAKVGTHPMAWKIWKKYADFEILRDMKDSKEWKRNSDLLIGSEASNQNSDGHRVTNSASSSPSVNTTNLIYYTALCAQVLDIDDLLSEYSRFIDLNFDKLKESITSQNPPEFRDERPNLLNHFLESNNDKATFQSIIARLGDKAREEISKRAPFEGALKTFHYDPSNATSTDLVNEKDNWKNYIQMETGEGNYQNAQLLYKRMLIPFYDDLSVWKDYIDFLATHMNNVEK
jgi:hypothetical protein